MLKPRKAKNRWTVTKRCMSRSSRAEAIVIRLPKGQGTATIEFEDMRKMCAELEDKLLKSKGRDDFFMFSGIFKQIFRIHRGEWILSWVKDRDQLYFHRKFPRPKPFTLSEDTLDKLLDCGKRIEEAKPLWPTGIGYIILMDEQGNPIKGEGESENVKTA